MNHIITRRVEFDAGHRVLGHEGKCRNLHGHRYVAEATVSNGYLDDIGRVVDFGYLKQLMQNWIDRNWDHQLLLNSDDPLIDLIEKSFLPEQYQPLYLFRGKNPTAENMAEELYKAIAKAIGKNWEVELLNVRIYETPNCWADYKED